MKKYYKPVRKQVVSSVRKKSTHSNRGKVLEHYIEQANFRYKTLGIALIKKQPTPIVAKTVDKKGIITYGWFDDKSTVDFEGIVFGKSVAFDAKETEVKTNFPLDNVKKHQVDYLIEHERLGGISFLIIHFSTIKETYIITIQQFNEWWMGSLQGGRKSIPLDFFKNKCKKCGPGRNTAIDYIACLEG
jgi:recombination protein U